MAAPEFPPLPLVDMHAAANTGNQWVAVTLQMDAGLADPGAAWSALFATPELLSALAPLECVLLLATPAILTPALLALLPPNRVLFAIDAAALADGAAGRAIAALQQAGYRILIDGAVPTGVAVPPTLRAVSRDCADGAGTPGALLALFGPHLARGVASAARQQQCAGAGFGWFSGAYPLHPAPSPSPDAEATSSPRRLLSLLGLLAADAGTRELESLLKQDAVLSYQLLKLVNSAAFAPGAPITSFAQAIGLLGRRQLQRWLQLLLFARPRHDGLANALLPLAALRAAQMEALCQQDGGAREAQDGAFMVGAFSLLDVLLKVPMADILDTLHLADDSAAALRARTGRLGQWLTLVERGTLQAGELGAAGVTPGAWWHSQLHAHQWAIQVSRSV